MPVISFKKKFFRFIKDNGIYHFIITQIKEEYDGIGEFIKYVCLNGLERSIFSSFRVLAFDWGERHEFWFKIHKDWNMSLTINEF